MQGFVLRRRNRILLCLSLAAGLAACGPRVDKTAAADVVVFLNAARTDDRRAFEAGLDRSAARDDLRAQFAELPGVKELQAQLGESMAETALDRLISPAAVRRLEGGDAVASTLADIRPRLRRIDKGRVCLRDRQVKDRCALTFAQAGKSWKLVGLHAGGQGFEPPAARIVSTGGEEAD